MTSLGNIVYRRTPSKPKEDTFLLEKLDKLDELVAKSGKVIFEAKSRFPLLYFPNKVTICPNRVTVTYGRGIQAEERPMLIEQINTARVIHGQFFSSLDMETFGVSKPEPIQHLDSMDARNARRYILALIECRKNNIDLASYDIDELREKLNELGRVYK